MKYPHLKNFIEYIKSHDNAAKNTVVNYEVDLKCFYNYTDGGFVLKKVHVKKYIDYLLNEKNYAPRTINRRISTLKKFYEYLEDYEIVENSPMNRISFITVPNEEKFELPTQDEIFAMLNEVTMIKERALLELMYTTGIRASEASELDIRHVDFNEGIIYISKSKNGKPRKIPTTKVALNYVKILIGHRSEGPVFLGKDRKRPLTTKSIYNICINHMKFNPHMLRHCFATHAIENSGNIKAVSESLGHSNTSITENIYTHYTIRKLKEEYRHFGMERDE